MPGMMDTVLNLGMNDDAVEGIARKSGNPRFAWDSYRRFVQMYGDVVLGMKPQNKDDIDPFEEVMEEVKSAKNIKNDTELSVDDLKELVVRFKAAVKARTGKDFPDLRRVRQLDERTRHTIPPHEPDSRRMGYGGKRASYGIRQYGKYLGYRCSIHS